MQPTMGHNISVPYSPVAQIQRDPAPKPTKLDEFKEAGRNYDPASPNKFIALCMEISDHIAEIRQNDPDNEAHVSAPVFDAIEELKKGQKYTAAQTFLRLIKVRLDTDYAKKMNELEKLIPDKNRIADQSNCFFTDDTERMNHIKNLFPLENQITCLSTEHTEKMIQIENFLLQIEKLVPVKDRIENQPPSIFTNAGYSKSPFPLNPQLFGTQALLDKETSAFTNTQPLLSRRLNFSLESFADETYKNCLAPGQGSRPRAVRNLLSQFNALLSGTNQEPSLTLSQKNSAMPPSSIPLTTGGGADFHQARELLRNSSGITKTTLSRVIAHLEKAIQLNHELAKTELNGLLKKVMNLRAEGKLTQITSNDWSEICSVMVEKTDDIETIRKLGIAFFNGNERLGIDKNLNRGRNCLEKLALLTPKGDLQSQLILAEHYLMLTEEPLSTQPQPTRRFVLTERSTASAASKARQFFMLAVTQHDSPDAKSRLKQMEEKVDRRDAQRNMTPRPQHVGKPVDKKVDQDIINQKFATGMKYLEGNEKLGLVKDPYLAFSYFYEAATQYGHVAANFELGKICTEILKNGINPASPTKLPRGLLNDPEVFYQDTLAYLNTSHKGGHPDAAQAIADLQSLYQQRMSTLSTEATVHQ